MREQNVVLEFPDLFLRVSETDDIQYISREVKRGICSHSNNPEVLTPQQGFALPSAYSDLKFQADAIMAG